jgi:hypothetical protein
MRTAPGDFARPRKVRAIYWTPASITTLAEVHPLLTAVLLMVPDRSQLLIQTCQVFDAASACPRGNFDVAADPIAGTAWGYFDKGNTDRPMKKPIAFAYDGRPDRIVEAFYRAFREQDSEG